MVLTESLIYKLWFIEEPTSDPIIYMDHGRREKIFIKQCLQLQSSYFSVPLSFRRPVLDIKFIGSCDVAVKRFESMELRLALDSKLQSLYIVLISKYLTLNHILVVQDPRYCFNLNHHIYQPHDLKHVFTADICKMYH